MAKKTDKKKKKNILFQDIPEILKDNLIIIFGIVEPVLEALKILGIDTVPIIYVRLGFAIYFSFMALFIVFIAPKRSNPRYEKIVVTILAAIFIYLLFIDSPNVLYRYSFEKNAEENICWRVRKDQDKNLLGESIALSNAAERLGNQSLAFSFALPNQFYDEQHLTIGQQVDLETESIRAEANICTGKWDVPYKGRIQTWICLPDTPEAANSVLTAEFFLQMEGGDWNASAPVMLEVGKWVMLRWDVENDKGESWRNWTQSTTEPTRPIAFGIEIKLDESSVQQTYQGTVYIDEVAILSSQDPYHLWMLQNNKYTHDAHCP